MKQMTTRWKNLQNFQIKSDTGYSISHNMFCWLLLTVKQLSSCTLNQLFLFCLIFFEVFMGLISFFTCRSLKTIYRQERLETYCLNLDLPSYYFNFVYAQSTNNTNQSYKLTTLYSLLVFMFVYIHLSCCKF